ncbi:hypothetical protein Sjap_001099 [Stephania japonica]|uniref:CASP-like protein n=1 Tax=Stephania japonica TaxID=461633 RepID=A0AAP0KL29_9MAGN
MHICRAFLEKRRRAAAAVPEQHQLCPPLNPPGWPGLDGRRAWPFSTSFYGSLLSLRLSPWEPLIKSFLSSLSTSSLKPNMMTSLICCKFLVIADAITAGYLAFSFLFSIFTIIRHNVVGVKLLLPILDTFDDFCKQTSGAAVAGFVVALLFMLMVVMSALCI